MDHFPAIAAAAELVTNETPNDVYPSHWQTRAWLLRAWLLRGFAAPCCRTVPGTEQRSFFGTYCPVADSDRRRYGGPSEPLRRRSPTAARFASGRLRTRRDYVALVSLAIGADKSLSLSLGICQILDALAGSENGILPTSGKRNGSRKKNTGVLFPTTSQLPSSV